MYACRRLYQGQAAVHVTSATSFHDRSSQRQCNAVICATDHTNVIVTEPLVFDPPGVDVAGGNGPSYPLPRRAKPDEPGTSFADKPVGLMNSDRPSQIMRTSPGLRPANRRPATSQCRNAVIRPALGRHRRRVAGSLPGAPDVVLALRPHLCSGVIVPDVSRVGDRPEGRLHVIPAPLVFERLPNRRFDVGAALSSPRSPVEFCKQLVIQ